MSLYLDLKAAITASGLKLKDVNDELNRRHGTNLSFQNFSNRVNSFTSKYKRSLTSSVMTSSGRNAMNNLCGSCIYTVYEPFLFF